MNLNVLILEDKAISAEYLKTLILKEKCFNVIDIVDNTKSAKEILKTSKVDIIFVDIMLKGVQSGAEFALEIKEKYPDILIIFATAYCDDEIMQYAINANTFAYTLKPYKDKEIKAILTLAKAKLCSIEQKDDVNKIELIDGYYFDMFSKQLFKGKEIIKLSTKEKKLIELLCKNPHNPLDSKNIENILKISNASLRSLIYRIRKEVDYNLIKSYKNLGYIISTK